MGLISLEGRTSWIFSSCGRCSGLTTGTSGTRSSGLRKGQSPCELLGGLSGFLSLRFRGLRPCVETVPESEDSSPVLTWILGYYLSLPRGVSPPLEWGHARVLSSQLLQQCHTSLRVDQGLCGFPSRLSHEAFPRGFPTGLSHVPPLCESILGLKIEAVQGKQFYLEWTEKPGASGNGGTTLEFLSPFLWRAPPVELRREHWEFFPDHAGKGSLLSSQEAETGLLWMWAGLSCFLSSGDGYVGELLELQQGCEGPFGSSRG